MRRLVGLVAVIAVVLVSARFAFRRPVEAELELDYGSAAPSLRQVDLIFTADDDHVERELVLLYPSGAPPRDTRKTRLHQGRYTVGAHLRFDGRTPATPSRTIEIDQSGRYTLDLKD